MSDEASNPLSGSEELLNSSKMSGKAALVINDQGKVLLATPECETAFNITEGQFILFDLDTQGIRTKLVTEDDDTPSALIPYLELHEIQHQGEHCFGLILDTSSPVQVSSPISMDTRWVSSTRIFPVLFTMLSTMNTLPSPRSPVAAYPCWGLHLRTSSITPILTFPP